MPSHHNVPVSSNVMRQNSHLLEILVKAIFTFLALLLSTGLVSADEADPVKMAREAGFTGCDAFIGKTFEHALKSRDRRIHTWNFNETKAEAITVTATFGLPGDSVYQMVHFSKKKGVCYSVMSALIQQEGNCTEILIKEDKNFSLFATQGDVLWARSEGGVTKLLRQAGSYCLQTYRVNKSTSDKD